jgi:hypothetical protein
MKKTLLFTSIILFVLVINTNAQVTFQLGGGVGYDIASGELGADIENMGDGNYGMDGGFNLHAKARVGLLSFIAAGEVGYTMMSNEGTLGPVKYENTLNILSLKVGPEFHFGLPLVPVDPYAGVNLQFNTFTGETKLQGVPGLASGTYNMESATRIGIGINGGVIMSLGGMKLDVNLSYNMLNLFGKDYETNPANDKIYLNDDEYEGRDAGSLSTIGAKVTLMFGL